MVGILVPGSSAFVVTPASTGTISARDRWRAGSRLAMVVWAAGTFPGCQAGRYRYPAELGRSLALFSLELRMELDREFGPVRRPRVVAVGHSFGGAVVGEAERYGLAVDAVLHVASAGVGRVRDPYDFPDPRRPRYSMTAPGDLIGLVQGLPTPPGLGHGPDPDDFRCVTTLPTGRLPDDPAARDELGRPLGERAGSTIGGVSSHSDVFIRYSDAWWGIYRFLVGTVPPPPECPPPDDEDPTRARLLPLAVPRVVTDSQCRAGGGLRPGGRHRPPAPRRRSRPPTGRRPPCHPPAGASNHTGRCHHAASGPGSFPTARSPASSTSNAVMCHRNTLITTVGGTTGFRRQAGATSRSPAPPAASPPGPAPPRDRGRGGKDVAAV